MGFRKRSEARSASSTATARPRTPAKKMHPKTRPNRALSCLSVVGERLQVQTIKFCSKVRKDKDSK
jgi:hypothetical protein